MTSTFSVYAGASPVATFSDEEQAKKLSSFINSQGGFSVVESTTLDDGLEFITVYEKYISIPDSRIWRVPRTVETKTHETLYRAMDADFTRLEVGETYWKWSRDEYDDFGSLVVFGTDQDAVDAQFDVLVDTLRQDATARKKKFWWSVNWIDQFDRGFIHR